MVPCEEKAAFFINHDLGELHPVSMPFSLPVDTGPSIKDFTSFSWANMVVHRVHREFWGAYLRVFLVNDEHLMNHLYIKLII